MKKAKIEKSKKATDGKKELTLDRMHELAKTVYEAERCVDPYLRYARRPTFTAAPQSTKQLYVDFVKSVVDGEEVDKFVGVGHAAKKLIEIRTFLVKALLD